MPCLLRNIHACLKSSGLKRLGFRTAPHDKIQPVCTSWEPAGSATKIYCVDRCENRYAKSSGSSSLPSFPIQAVVGHQLRIVLHHCFQPGCHDPTGMPLIFAYFMYFFRSSYVHFWRHVTSALRSHQCPTPKSRSMAYQAFHKASLIYRYHVPLLP